MDQFQEQNEALEVLCLPSGYRFNPTNTEVVVHYLKRRIMGERLPANVIPTTDVYACNPEQLPFSLFKYGHAHEWFFFSKRRKGKILTQDGYYDICTSAREAIYENENTGAVGSKKTRNLVGLMRKLDFYHGRPPSGIKSKWSIEEFRINPGTIEVESHHHALREKVLNMVVCKVINNEPPPKPQGWIELSPGTYVRQLEIKGTGEDKE